jgi:CubicO group peptidase (beta-lactamase class C family)
MRSTGLIIGMIAAVFVSGLAWGQEPRIAAPTPTPSALPPQAVASTQGAAALTAQDVSTWLDGFMPYALQTGDIAGAEVVVVKGGAVLVSKGYGYADVARRTPVDPEHHLFRPGSVSKLFTWTAVMQQVERAASIWMRT